MKWLSRYLYAFSLIVGLSSYSLAADVVTQKIAPETTLSQQDRKLTHTLSLVCPYDKNLLIMSRLSVLDSPQLKELDVGVTTGHGVLDANGTPLVDCIIADFSGNKYEVKSIIPSDDYVAGTANDWAVITFEPIQMASIVRYSVAHPLPTSTFDSLADAQMMVQFSSARGLADNAQLCTIFPSHYAGFNKPHHTGLLPHSCQANPGQSGAPISIVRDQDNIIVGFHMGHAMSYGTPTYNHPGRYGYMRIFDDKLQDDVNTIIMNLIETGKHQ